MSGRRTSLALAALGVGAVAAILIAERRRPSRPVAAREPQRTIRNLALGASCLVVIRLAEKPLLDAVAETVEQRRLGIAQRLPERWRDPAAFLLLDWGMYLWHVATHKVPLLWRLHLVHHVDQDMDASTALRFHAADMLVSIPFRAAQITLAGAGPRAHRAWQSFFFLSVLFHHSRIRLAAPWERRLSRVLTTPGMHDIHHRAVQAATDSNWSSGLALWDHLHRTFRGQAPVAPIGVAGYRAPGDAGLATALALPFVPQKDPWPAPARSDGHGDPRPGPSEP